MAELKTKPSAVSVQAFLSGVTDDTRRSDSLALLKIMKQATGAEPKMWGSSLVGFGSYHYKYSSGREGDWFIVGFSPRKPALTVYIMDGFDRYNSLLRKLGKHKKAKSCLYIKRLSDIDLSVLKALIQQSARHVKQ